MDITKLESLLDTDQKAIKDFRSGKISGDELSAISAENLRYIVDVIERFGFPFENQASQKAYKAAFLAVLHSEDVQIMQRATDIFLKASDKEIEKRDLAYLIDKLLVIKGLPQIYGTQYKIKEDRSIEFLPIKDEPAVDQKRRELELGPISEYKQFAEESLKS